MKIHSTSYFKNEMKRDEFFKSWISRLEKLNETVYQSVEIETFLGKTKIWQFNAERTDLKTLVIFPGFRTSSLFWDTDNALKQLKSNFRIFLVETNGQPVLSEGKTPDIRSNDYGVWGIEVLDKLKIEKCSIAGASFGGLVCVKIGLVAPERIEKMFLLNPGCLQTFSFSWKNMYYNFLPLISPTKKNIRTFLENGVFFPGHHMPSPAALEALIDFEHFAITEYVDKAQKPYAIPAKELSALKSKVYLLLGEKDLLFPCQKSEAIARKCFRNLGDVRVLKNTGHGIETSKEAINIINDAMLN